MNLIFCHVNNSLERILVVQDTEKYQWNGLKNWKVSTLTWNGGEWQIKTGSPESEMKNLG